MRRRTLALSVAAVLLAPAQAHAASLSLRPAIAPPGATVAVEGAGWRAGSTVTVRRKGGAALARAVVGFDGKLATSLRVPRNFKVRTQPLQARGRGPGQAVDAALRVVATTRDWAPREIASSTGVQIDVSRTVAFPTAVVRIDARGLREGDVASAQLRGGPPVTARANRRGRATLRLAVPETRLEGSTIRLRAGRIRRVEPFYVVPPQTTVPPCRSRSARTRCSPRRGTSPASRATCARPRCATSGTPPTSWCRPSPMSSPRSATTSMRPRPRRNGPPTTSPGGA